jgi:hypothetical protein
LSQLVGGYFALRFFCFGEGIQISLSQ